MEAREKATKQKLYCPYCDEEIMAADLPYCQVCKIEVFYCPECGKPLPREKRVCPHCGVEVKGEKSRL
jgi:hypothetical protein